MNKKIVSAILCGAMILGSAVPAMAGSADGKKIALVGKSAGNAFFEIAAKSFVETAEAEVLLLILFIQRQLQQMLRSKFLTT